MRVNHSNILKNAPLLTHPAPWLFGVALAVYLPALHSNHLSWDSAEFALGVYTQGIVHATGYPLYLMVARLFTLLIPGDFLWRLNLFSTVMAALSVALIGACVYRRATRYRWLSAFAVLLLAGAPAYWEQAVITEVYTFHTALIAATLWCWLAWENGQRPRYIWGVFIGLGLALANHLAALLVVAILVPAVLRTLFQRREWRQAVIGLGVMGLITGGLYLYLPLRFAAHPAFNLVNPYFARDLTKLGDLLWMVSGRMFGPEMFAYPLDAWFGEILHFVGELWTNYYGIGFLLGLYGIAHYWQRCRRETLVLLLLGGAQVLFFTSYRTFDKWEMFHTAYLIWAFFAGMGLDAILRASLVQPARFVLAGTFCLQMVINITSLSAGESLNYAAEVLSKLPPKTLLIGPWTTLRPIEYLQTIEGQRQDVRLVDVTIAGLAWRDRYPNVPLINIADVAIYANLAWRDWPVYLIDHDDESPTVDGYRLVSLLPGLFRVERVP